MAVFHFSADIIQRAKGHSVVAAAAYRAGERILEIRTGEVHDYRRRSGVDHREIMAPRGAPGWCKTRAELWNRAEDAERRKDAQVGRQVELALPRELSFKQRRRLVRRFVRKNFTCRGMVADIAYHDQAGENPHVHILLTMRRLAKENGFSRTKERAWNEKAQLESWRSSWALHVNASLRRAGCHSRVDHRTLEAQRLDALAAGDLGLAIKLDRAPGRHIGRAPVAIQARADGIAALAAAQDDAIRTGEVDQPDYEHPAYKAAEYERSWRMQEVLDERERETERRWEDREGERANRNASRLFGLFAQPGGRDVYRAAVTEVITAWRPSVVDLPELPESPLVDRALDVAESSGGCLRRLRDLLEDAEGRSHYRGILDAHGEPISLEDVNGAIEEANRRIAAAADRRDRRRTILFGRPGGRDLYVAMLGEVESARGPTGEPSAATEDLVLDAVESEAARLIRLETLFQKPWGRGLYVANMRALGDRVTLPEIDAAVAAGEALARRAHCVVEGQALRAPLDVALLESEDTTVGDLESAVERAEERRFEERRAAEQEALRERARIEAEIRLAEARRLAAEQRKRKERLEGVESQASGRDLYEKKLDDLDPGWRGRGEPKGERADAALTYAETELARIETERRAAEARRRAEEQRKRKERLESVESQASGRDLYEKKLDDLDPGWRGRGDPKVGAIDTALTYAETELKHRAEARQQAEREKRDAARRAGRVEELFEEPGGDAGLFLALDRQKPDWRKAGTPGHVDSALDLAKHNVDPEASATHHRLVRNAEQTFQRATSMEWRMTSGAFSGSTTADNRGRAVSRLLSDRARAREIVAGPSDVASSPSVVARLVVWLRREIEKLLRGLQMVKKVVDAVMVDLRQTWPLPHTRFDHWVPLVSNKAAEPAPDADAFVREAYAGLRDRLDLAASAHDGYRHRDRERCEEAHLAPLVDGTLRRQQGSWSASSGAPRPTRESARAVAFERHRQKIEQLIQVACYQVAGRPASAEGLEQHLEDVRCAADAVMKGLPTRCRWPNVHPDRRVPAVLYEAVEPASAADPIVTDVYAEVRDQLNLAAGADDGYSFRDREWSEEAHLAPLVDGTLRRQQGSWSASSGAPRPTRESARAEVFERHRQKIEALILVACYQVAGRPASAEGLEQHLEDVRCATDAVMKGLPTRCRWPNVHPDRRVPAVLYEAVEPASATDPIVTDVYAEVRDRLDLAAGADDGYSFRDREWSEEAHLAPLVDGTLRRQQGSWSASSGAPRPTRESARAEVFERHRRKIEELILVACYQVAGRPASAEGLEQHLEDVRCAADAVMKGLPTTCRWPNVHPDRRVPAVLYEAVEPASAADPIVTDVYAEVRDRLDLAAGADDGYSFRDREWSEEAHLAPLVDGTLRRQQGSWSASSGAPRPTRESARAEVFERHRQQIEALIQVACYQVAGRPASAEGLEQHLEDVRRVADAVMVDLSTTDHRVPLAPDKATEPAPDADALVTDAFAEVRDRLDRASAADGGYSELNREWAEERYVDRLLEETLEQQRRTLASEAELSSQRREVARKRLEREHRARLLNTVMAACLKLHGDGALGDGRSGRISGPAQVAGAASPTEVRGATTDDGRSLDAGRRLVADQSWMDPAEETAGASHLHHPSPPSVPAANVTIVVERGNETFRIKEETEQGTSRLLKEVHTVLEGLNWLASQGFIESESIPEREKKIEMDLSRERSR